MGHNKLTEKQEGFASDIANKKYKYHWEAYAANYGAEKMSKNTLYVKTCELLANGKVAVRVKELEEKIRAKEKITLDEIIVKLSQRVNMDLRAMFNDDNTFKNIKDLTQEQAMFLCSFEVTTAYKGDSEEPIRVEVKKIKFESIKDMLDMLVRHYGGYAKDEDKTSDIEHIKDIVEQLTGKNESN